MARRDEVFQAKGLKSEHLIGPDRKPLPPVYLTIDSIENVEFEDDPIPKRGVNFREDGRQLILNATNWDAIDLMTGETGDDDNWIGAVIGVRAELTTFKGKSVWGLRVCAPPASGYTLGFPARGAAPAAAPAAPASPAATLQFGADMATRLRAKLEAEGVTLDQLRNALTNVGHAQSVAGDIETWPKGIAQAVASAIEECKLANDPPF